MFKVALSFTFCSKTIEPKSGNKEVNNTNFGFFLRMCRCYGNKNKYNQAFKIVFVYL